MKQLEMNVMRENLLQMVSGVIGNEGNKDREAYADEA